MCNILFWFLFSSWHNLNLISNRITKYTRSKSIEWGRLNLTCRKYNYEVSSEVNYVVSTLQKISVFALLGTYIIHYICINEIRNEVTWEWHINIICILCYDFVAFIDFNVPLPTFSEVNLHNHLVHYAICMFTSRDKTWLYIGTFVTVFTCFFSILFNLSLVRQYLLF